MKFFEHQKAIKLRKLGRSVKEIARSLKVSPSTVSLWVRDISLSENAIHRLRTRITAGQLASGEAKKRNTEIVNITLRQEAAQHLRKIKITPATSRLICSLLYWCEGVKAHKNGIAFTNSDPNLTRVFIDLLVSTFHVHRSKINCRLHLHEYHNEATQLKFWSQKLNIPSLQFRKTYWKPHTGIRKRENYPGCISVRYYDSILARKVMFFAQAYLHGGVVQW